MTDITSRLRQRRTTRWIHSTGQTPQASGYSGDAECNEAADEIDRLRALRQPLTDEQIAAIKDVSLGPVQYGGHEGMTPERTFDVVKFARAIEKAHGIGEQR